MLRVNGVVVDRHGLTLRENEATDARKAFRYLPGLWDLVNKSKMGSEVQKIYFPESDERRVLV